MVGEEDGDKYDIIAESKRKAAKAVKEQKEFTQISKNVMSNKNRKLLKLLEKNAGEKRAVAENLTQKSKKLKQTK
jgi:hypothetical protein